VKEAGMTETKRLRLVTIIGEAVLERRLLAELPGLGATGWSLGRVDGQGSRGVRSTGWEGPNLRLETVVNEEVADRILGHLAAEYFDRFAIIAYVVDVDVVRGDKYVQS
jgi:nitrogen regulatory protein P-II 2